MAYEFLPFVAVPTSDTSLCREAAVLRHEQQSKIS